jgi:hypothetical protein
MTEARGAASQPIAAVLADVDGTFVLPRAVAAPALLPGNIDTRVPAP